jgi:hypothetical protein
MRRAIFGLKEIMIAILATLILMIIAVLLFNLVNPASTATAGFGQQVADVFN